MQLHSSLRALRAFRPLRAAHMLPGVRKQVDTIFGALPKLGSVIVLIAFVGSAFGILGMQVRLTHPTHLPRTSL